MSALTNKSGVSNLSIILQTMDAVTQRTVTIVFIVEFIIGILGNGFIVLVNCMDWWKRRKLSSVDQILTALAISRIVLLMRLVISILLYFDHPHLFMSKNRIRMVSISWMVVKHFSIWLATCLSIFYFLKVGNFSNSTFRSLQWRLKEVVLVTLLVSLLLLSLNIVVINAYIDFWIDGSISNKTYSSTMMSYEQLTKVILFTSSVFTFMPFTVSLATFLLLFISLRTHLRNMRLSAAGCRDASTTAHVRALQTMLAFLLLHIFSLLSLLIEISSFKVLEQNTIIVYEQITGTAFPVGHSYVLILADSKLRQASHKVLWWVRCKLRDVRQFCP